VVCLCWKVDLLQLRQHSSVCGKMANIERDRVLQSSVPEAAAWVFIFSIQYLLYKIFIRRSIFELEFITFLIFLWLYHSRRASLDGQWYKALAKFTLGLNGCGLTLPGFDSRHDYAYVRKLMYNCTCNETNFSGMLHTINCDCTFHPGLTVPGPECQLAVRTDGTEITLWVV